MIMKTYKVEQLRQAVNEVDDLRHEEQEQRFAEVAENGDNCQRHSAETKKIWWTSEKQKSEFNLER